MPFLILAILIGIETYGVLQAIKLFGGAFTLLWLFGAAVAGAYVIAKGGMTTLRRVQLSVARGDLPTADLFAGLVTGFAGLLLILPGFFTDVIAISLLVGGGGIRKRLGEKLSGQMAQARPDLKRPVTLEGEYRRKPQDQLRK